MPVDAELEQRPAIRQEREAQGREHQGIQLRDPPVAGGVRCRERHPACRAIDAGRGSTKASSKAGLARKTGSVPPQPPHRHAAAQPDAHVQRVVAGTHVRGGRVGVVAHPVFDVGPGGPGEALVAAWSGRRQPAARRWKKRLNCAGHSWCLMWRAAPVDVLEPDLDRASAVEEDGAARDLLGLGEHFGRGLGRLLAGKFGERAGALEEGLAAGRPGGGAARAGRAAKRRRVMRYPDHSTIKL